ncbi:MAG: pyridoxal phosphate-dependent aminotransferase family protein, partial [Candidatus Gastranaerophilales bacterium]|nr:pyridoxal phosphate-dependent aminotransferase family protein [Candidatus Gastranaerophilales bacterium]
KERVNFMVSYENELKKLKESGMYRQIPEITKKNGVNIIMNGRELLNLSSNDYLNFSTNEDLAKEFMEDFLNNPHCRFSSASARLLSGTSAVYRDLEQVLADLFGKEAALIFNTGYQCNLGVVSTLARGGDVIFSDKLNHASIIDGIKLSGADFHRYKHLDYDHLEELLEKHRSKYDKALIVSETIFSMDGDVADISRLVELKKKYNAILMLDEAHAFCTMDDNFAGMSDGNSDVDIVTATFGKALGSFGAFVVSNKTIINYLINKARSFIFSTSIPPINIAWTKWLLTEKLDYISEQKMKLAKIIIGIHKYLKSTGVETASESQIIPLVFRDEKKTVEIAEQLMSMGYYVMPIRPPTVPPNTSRLRLSLTADMDFESIKSLIDFVKDEL